MGTGNNLLLRRRLGDGQLVITLEQNKDQAWYNQFYQDWAHNGYLGVTPLGTILKRQFTQDKKELLCLPFDVNPALFTTLGFGSRVFDFRYAQYNETTKEYELLFHKMRFMKAGHCYVVNANKELADKKKFGFLLVKITSPIIEPDQVVARIDLSDVEGFDKLPGTNSSGDMEIVGTLRAGNLQNRSGYESPYNYYQLDKNNKLKIINLNQPNRILAYRGVFRIPKKDDPANPPN